MPKATKKADAGLVTREIQTLTDAFCAAHLDDEYRDLCRRLVAKLGRKKEPPFVRGDPGVWAAAIVHVIGTVNFLFDKTQVPHMTATQLSERAGVSKASAETRSREIRKLLKIVQLEPEWSRPSQLEHNPFAWMIEVDGIIVDARSLPEHVQHEARRLGLIPERAHGT